MRFVPRPWSSLSATTTARRVRRHLRALSRGSGASRRLSIATVLVGFLAACTWLFAGGAATTATAQDATPDRVYELVSPIPTGGIPAPQNRAIVATGDRGDRVIYGTNLPFPDSTPLPDEELETGTFSYVFTRGAAGWEVENIGLSYTPLNFSSAAASRDTSRFLGGTRAGLDPDDQNRGTDNVNVDGGDLYQYQSDGSITWISRDPRIPQGTPQTDPLKTATATNPLAASTMSVDGRTVVFTSQRQLSDDDTTAGSTQAHRRLYKWTDGELSFIGKRPDGSVPTDGSHLGSNTGAGSTNSARGAVSEDGTRVVFGARRADGVGDVNSGRTLYVQTDGEATVEALKETGVDALVGPEPHNPTYWGASSDASRAFFTTSSRLTPDSGAQRTPLGDQDLYVYDIDADKVRNLTPRLDGVNDPNVDPAAADRAGVHGVPWVSEDGDRVYFVAKAAYPNADPSPTGATPVANGRNLYVAELDGIDDPIELKFVAALGTADGTVWTVTWDENRRSYASPDGSVLGFGSKQELTGDDLGGTEQLYVYDVDAHSLDCASCPKDGSAPAGDVNPLVPDDDQIAGETWQFRAAEKRWVSSTGSVFFVTATPLTGEDRNDTDDVYEYRGGELELISTGRVNRISRFENANLDGSTVYFTTSEALDPRDNEPGIPKLYAARVGGGFPPPPTPPAPCEGDECKDEIPGAPETDEPATGNPGPGNLPEVDRERCQQLEDRAQRAGKRSNRLKRQSNRLKRQSNRLKRKANRADGEKAIKRLNRRSKQANRKANRKNRRSTRMSRQADRLEREAIRCRGGSQ